MKRIFVAILLLAGLGVSADAGFRSPESVIRNVYAYYGNGTPDLSKGLPRDDSTAQKFFDASLKAAWTAPRHEPYDFLVQGTSWKLSAISISILRKQYDKTYVAVAFDNQGRSVRLNFILVNDRDGWVITDIETPHDLLRAFLEQFRN